MKSKRIGRTAQISGLTGALLMGVYAGRQGLWVDERILFLLGLAAVVSLVLKSPWAFITLLIFTLIFGIWRGYTTDLPKTAMGFLTGQKVELTGVVTDDPGRNDKNQIVFTLGSTKISGQADSHSVRVTTGYKDLARGYHVAVSGKLRESIGAVPVQITFAKVTVLSTDVGWLERFRAKFFAGMRSAMPEPMSGFGLGLLVGVRSLIDKPLQETLSLVGLSHLVAVSGYNLTIIIQAVQKIAGRLSLFLATMISLWLMALFLLVAGFSASIVRAAIVSSLGILITYYGYEASPMTLIALPAALTVAVNPDYLMRDLGWQLSFLAFFGILVIAPAVEAKWVKWPNAIKSLLIESTSAHIITLPLIIQKFGALSMVAPVSNVIILPLVPLAMLLSFLAGIGGMIIPAQAGYISMPAAGLLGLMVGLSQWFARWPMASVQAGLSDLQTVILYVIIVFAVLLVRRNLTTVRLPNSNLSGVIVANKDK